MLSDLIAKLVCEVSLTCMVVTTKAGWTPARGEENQQQQNPTYYTAVLRKMS